MTIRNQIGLPVAAALLLAAVHLGASPSQEEGGGTAAGGEAMPELDLPDTLPLIPVRPDPSAWDYDDMSKSYDFEILSSGYWFTPVPDDPINEYLNEQLNANIEINFLPGDDLVNQLTTRFIAGDPPAITTLGFGQKNVAKKLHEDGLLLNVEPYLQYLPTWQQFLTKDYKAWATSSDDGVMYGLPRYRCSLTTGDCRSARTGWSSSAWMRHAPSRSCSSLPSAWCARIPTAPAAPTPGSWAARGMATASPCWSRFAPCTAIPAGTSRMA